jgi:hypothetical protein
MTADDLHIIHSLVMARFPKLPTERGCITEKRMRDAAREAYRTRLIHDITAKKIVLETLAPTAKEA